MSSKTKKSEGAPKCSNGGGRKSRFPELPPKYSSSRELRNKAEKMRRDRLNKLIEEMRTLVPIICSKTNKCEKTRSNILRLTANYLKVSRLFPQDTTALASHTPNKNALLGEGLPHLESMEGFFFILAEDGRVLFVSENVDKFIGFSQIEMMGFPIYTFTHPGDQNKLQSNLSKNEGLVSSSSPSHSSTFESASTLSVSKPIEDRGPRQSFYIRLREKPLAKTDTPQYEHMHVVGHLRRADHAQDKQECVGQHTFIGVMRPVRDRPITELSLMESIQDQYLTRHLPDGRIIYTDHRISTIAGYLPSEVKGKSAFNFFYAEDLPWTTMAMRHMFASSNGEGTTVYRLFTQTGELICLQTKGFLEFNKTTNKIESFLCINTVIRQEDTEYYLNEQKERFSPLISELQMNAINTSNEPLSLECLTSTKQVRSPPQVSVISKSSQDLSLPSFKPTIPQHIENTHCPLKRAAENWEYIYSDEPPRKKSFAPDQMTGSSPVKRKSEETHLPGLKVSRSWQYTPARHEPIHRTEEGVRVVDIEQQLYTEGNTSFQRNTDHGNLPIDFQGLINQLNQSHQSRTQPDTQPDTTYTNGISPGRRTGSVIKLLPTYNKGSRSGSKSPLPSSRETAESSFELLNKKEDTEPNKEYIPREVDLIKEELIHSTTTEADRIAEKLKAMLAPLSGKQNILEDTKPQVKECHEDVAVTAAVYTKDKESAGSYKESDLLEILDQDLLFSIGGDQTENRKHQVYRKDELQSS